MYRSGCAFSVQLASKLLIAFGMVCKAFGLGWCEVNAVCDRVQMLWRAQGLAWFATPRRHTRWQPVSQLPQQLSSTHRRRRHPQHRLLPPHLRPLRRATRNGLPLRKNWRGSWFTWLCRRPNIPAGGQRKWYLCRHRYVSSVWIIHLFAAVPTVT